MSYPVPPPPTVPRAAAVRELAGVLVLLAGVCGLVGAAFLLHPVAGLAVVSAALVAGGVALVAPQAPRGPVEGV